VGTNNQVLAADSSETTGVKWVAATDLISSASTSVAGKVQLEDSVSSTSTTKAATPKRQTIISDDCISLSRSWVVTKVKPQTKVMASKSMVAQNSICFFLAAGDSGLMDFVFN
jgi:hypothetical protein